ncbi:MAG: aldehyde dehydrogenase family protein [Thermoanaerobacterales bacterium]|nr:aldehyde dehydrogenase family protein [Thermoanaerobacterales bacterium]
MTVEVLNRIGDELRPASDGAVVERRNPADHRQVVSVAPESTAEDVRDAVSAAVAAQPAWAATPPSARAAVLERAADILAGRAEEIARELTAEEGKPLADARAEASRTPTNLRLYAGEAVRLTGATFPSDDGGALVYTRLDPLGVVGAITPWNFPLNLAARKIGPALAAGNAVVFKPSPHTPLMGERLAAALAEAGLPPGVLNVVHGFAAGAALVADERVDGVTFTGSTATGAAIHAALGPHRRAQLELGGNNPVVVLADADLDRAAAVVAASSFNLSGQACTGAGRILVAEEVHDELVERVAARARALVLGPGDREGVTTGPLVTEDAVKAMAAVVEEAVADGAEVVVGGRRGEGPDLEHGWFWEPTLLVGARPGMRLVDEEVFGPVVGVERVADLDEALARANDTPYGLTAACCTTSLAAAQRFAAEIRAGMCRINRPTVGTAANAPFGGIKRSGSGAFKEQLGPGTMDFHVTARTVFLGS